jgi:hypothetical protein
MGCDAHTAHGPGYGAYADKIVTIRAENPELEKKSPVNTAMKTTQFPFFPPLNFRNLEQLNFTRIR